MVKRWLYKPIPPTEQIETLSRQLNINQYLTAILIQRGITTYETAHHFFRPQLSDLHDPFLMTDMEQAVARLHYAIENNEKILVYGDYDVDGTTAVALVYSYLKNFYPHCDFYIPDRHKEGYGVSEAGIRYATENNVELIIALDLGIKASDMVKFAYHQGIDFIICDHHLPDEAIPQAVAVLDPKRPDCNYPFQELSGCGIGFKLIQGYARTHREEHEIFDYLDLVAVSIASDIVPINGENRVLSFYGLQKLNQNPRPGLKALRDISGIKADQDVSGVVFTLGPRINAAGRVDHGRAAVELLVAESEDEANEMAGKINSTNDLRREFDVNITEEAIAMIEGNEALRTAKSTVLFKNTWNKGVIGIVAARCVERYYRPTIILTESNERITGSARSVAGFNLYDAIEQCSDLLEKFGGHKYAAGLTLLPQNLAAFQKRFEEIVASTLTDDMRIPIVDIDLPIHLDLINPRFFNILKQMAPFGPENQKPVFESRGLQVANSLSSFKDKHMRFLVGQSGSDQIFTVMAFDLIEHYARLQNGDMFRMAYTIEENTFNGNTSIQLRAKDIKFD